jgi:hypothetical protein
MATLPVGNDVVVIVTKPSMAMLNGAEVPVAGGISESATWTVNVEGPKVVGIPEIIPLLGSRLNPAGKAPLLTLHVYGISPPVAVRVAL